MKRDKEAIYTRARLDKSKVDTANYRFHVRALTSFVRAFRNARQLNKKNELLHIVTLLCFLITLICRRMKN